MGQGEALLGALFPIEPLHSPDVMNSYSSWLARQEQRTVQG